MSTIRMSQKMSQNSVSHASPEVSASHQGTAPVVQHSGKLSQGSSPATLDDSRLRQIVSGKSMEALKAEAKKLTLDAKGNIVFA